VKCHREWQRERFHRLSGVEYNRRLLKMRRIKALHRLAARNEREVWRGPLFVRPDE
jgi:hypothetical protein